MHSELPKKGDRFVVKAEFETIVLTHWRAPMTGGYVKLIPAGLEFVVANDPPVGATAVGAEPCAPDQWEEALIDEVDRTAEKYGGYSISIPFDLLHANCSRL